MSSSNHPQSETPIMPYRREAWLPYESVKAECQTINEELERIITEVRRVADTYGHIPLPLTFLQPGEHEDNASRIVHASLLKLDVMKHDISMAQWEQYQARYNAIITDNPRYDNKIKERVGQRSIYFSSEMSDVLERLGDYVEANGILQVAPKAFFGDKPSTRFFATVAVLHTAAWLQQQKEQAEPKS